jgi:hypothetical protein
MIRKGLKARVRPALDFAGEGEAHRMVLPFRRSWIAISILAAFDIAFLIPAIMTFQQAATEWGKFDDLFDLVSALFLTAWLVGWSIGPLLMTSILALMLFGREVIKTYPGVVEVFIGIPLLGLAARYQVSGMRNLRLAHPPKKSGTSWRGSHLCFDYGGNTIAVGSDVSGEQISELRDQVQMTSGTRLRKGDALPEELQGDWAPDALSVLSSASEAQADAAAPGTPATLAPVTLASPSTVALIIANLAPIFGAIFMGWNLSDVMVLYWAETAIIGVFNIVKIAMVSGWAALLAGPFFAAHFGGFMSVHFLFIYGIFIQGPQDLSGGKLSDVVQLFVVLWPALAALFASHAFSFFHNFVGRREYRGRTLNKQMMEPYSRIIFMHLVIIFGGGLTLVLGEPTPVLLIVMGLKIWVDVKAHTKQRKDSSPR